jgi:hypothetical protein
MIIIDYLIIRNEMKIMKRRREQKRCIMVKYIRKIIIMKMIIDCLFTPQDCAEVVRLSHPLSLSGWYGGF